MDFQIKLAEHIVEIDCYYALVWDLVKEYVVSEKVENPDIYVRITKEDVEYERYVSEREEKTDCEGYEQYVDAIHERLAVYRKVAVSMLEFDCFLMHGSVVAVDQDAYLFTALSGTGKTTHTNLWLKNVPGSYILNGDKPLIWSSEHETIVYGTPWAGKEGKNCDTSAKLRAIIILERSEENNIEEISFSEALPSLIQQTYRPSKTEEMYKTFELIERLEKNVRFYRLHCNMDDEAAILSSKVLMKSKLTQGI